MVGQGRFHPARRPRIRRHFPESPNPVKISMPKLQSRARLFRILYFLNFLYLLCLLCLPSFAEHTRRWRQSTYDEFLNGTAHGVAARRDGRLELAPTFTLSADAEPSSSWSVLLHP